MRIEKNSGALPSWLDSFVNKIQNKKVATKNVKNLPTVTWKNETYYVNLTDDGAVLYNDQANEVMSMDGVKSIEQVNDELNKDSVVASKTKLADDGNDSTDSQTITEDDGSGDVEASKSNYFDLDKTAKNEDMPTDNDGMESEIGGFGVPTDQIQDVSDSINKGVEDISSEPHEGVQDIVGRPHTGIEEAGTDKYQNNAGSNDVEFENELAKVADLEDGQPQATEEGQENISTDTTNSGENQQEQSTTASINEGIEDVSGEPHEGIDDISGEPHETIEEAGTDKYQHNANDGDVAPEEVSFDTDNFVSKASYNRLLAKVKKLEKKLSAIDKKAGYYESVAGDDMSNMRIMSSEPPSNDADSRDLNNAEQFGGIFDKKKRKAYTEAQHAYTSPENDAYDLNSQDEEVKHFNESEKATQKVIDREHELDLSKMSDRAKLNEYFLDDIDKEMDVVDEALNDVPSHDELVDMVEQDPQGAGEEEIDTPEVEDEVIKVDDETPTDEVEIETDAPVEEVVEELPDDEKAVVVEEEPTDMPVIVTLDSPDDVDKFVNQQCPICNAKKSLQGIQKVASLTGVVCKHCGQEYAVGNDHIYLKK